VDEQVHCSVHMRRTDKSERVVCGTHRAGCALEGVTVVFASDEIQECPVCRKRVCAAHLVPESGRCVSCAPLVRESATD
jgi:hypothetical protein